MTRDNLSSHLSRMEEGGYVEINKRFRGKYPHITCALNERGRRAFREYWAAWQ
ncbi:MAG: transcriptional regulator [Chloroflexota bacterium]|nr:transcriptional regulator [Chloroflexota bacterium]